MAYTGCTAGTGGAGGGGAGGVMVAGTPGTVNTGGGGGGAGRSAPAQGGAGGSGIVILRAPGPAGPSLSVSPGCNVKDTLPAPEGSCTVLTFIATGKVNIG
tara:strand:- start:60 stop:362 length:303 start_codon:yes stop_codon:yes gene_type:complete